MKDYYQILGVSDNASQGDIKREKQTKKLLVKIPHSVKAGTKIRLKGMGKIEGEQSGDLYLHIKFND